MLFRYFSKIPFVVMTLLACILFATTMVYWSFRPDINFLLTKQNLVDDLVWRTAFYIHIFGGMLSIIIGPLQFIQALRIKFLKLHKLLGKIYVGSILFIAAPTGFYMAFYANGGLPAVFGFILMSLLWFYTTFMGIRTILNKQIEEHKKWMIRSYAVTFSAVTLRLWVPVLSLYFHVDHLTVVIATAWISWLFNLLAAEFIINLKKNKIYDIILQKVS